MADKQTNEIANDVEWLSGLSSRFPTHKSVQRFRLLLTKIAKASVYDPGETDLDDEQHVSAHLNLGDVRLARRLLR
jgi:hypothetical protein